MGKEFAIDLLLTFSAVCEFNSFTQAGDALHITQTAVSMRMRRLEEEAGRPLFEKEGRSFRLTAAGETMLEYSRRILSAHNEAVAAFSRPELIGRIRFGCGEDYASIRLSDVLTGFRRYHPCIRVDIHSATSTELQQRLNRDELDLCLLDGSLKNGRVVRQEPVVWAASRHGCAHKEDPVPLAVYNEGCAYRKWAIEALENQGKAYWISFVSPSISSILAAVRAGLAVAPLGASNLDDSLFCLGPDDGFPLLPVSELSLHRSFSAADDLTSCFEYYVIESFRSLTH